jgi:hypothetical protein
MDLLGSPWAPAKSQLAASGGDFLGLQHDFSEVGSGIISFWPRDTLITKVMDITGLALESGLPPGTAAKLYGVVNFLELGMFGRIGRAGLDAIKVRQYSYDRGFEITHELENALNLIRSILVMQPRREFTLFSSMIRRVLVASDASYEAGVGNAGFLFVGGPGTATESRHGYEVIIPAGIYNYWGPQSTYIAQLELMVVLCSILEMASEVRDSRGIWFIDNSAALMALVHGKSGSSSLDIMARFVHMACFALRANPYYEYVESKSNWSDEISREGLKGAWARNHSFSLSRCSFFFELLDLPCEAVVTIFSFL